MSDERPTFGSLFAGIGGIDLGLERAGWTGRWQVEYEPFCQRVLAKHWPDVQRYGDIHDVDWSRVEPVDLIAGGFPCQPVSIAGRKRAQADDRWLWPEFARAVRALRPRHVLVENVTNLLGVERGSAFGEVVGDLASLGYDAEWDCIPAAAVGAPHLRDRVWIVGTEQSGTVADPCGRRGPNDGLRAGRDESRSSGQDRTLADDARVNGRAGERALDGGPGGRGDGLERPDSDPCLAYAASAGLQGRTGRGVTGAGRSPIESPSRGEAMAYANDSRSQGHRGRGYLGSGASERLARSRRDAIEGQWLVEPDVGRVAARFSAGLDDPGGRVDGHPGCLQKASTTGIPSTDRLRVLREYIRSPEASSRPGRCALCGHPLSALPCSGTCVPWYLGARTDPDEDVRCLREGVYAIGTLEEGEALLARVPRGDGSAIGEQAVARRTDRLRALGNAVVPQVVEFIGRRILEADSP